MANLLPFLQPGRLEAGCDEAGRGCLAGPVFAAAVILPEKFSNSLLDDSKKLSEKTRLVLRHIIEKEAIAFSVAHVSPGKIDEINILKASILAMHMALDNLQVRPEYLLIDGHRFHPYQKINHSCEIKGDGRFLSIAAASVLAKTYRDEYMKRLHEQFPYYGWNRNKGYPTKFHRKAINDKGISPHHRLSFKLLDNQLHIEF